MPTATPTLRPTAPLPQPARDALARLESAFRPTPTPSPAVLRLRMQVRAAGYNPDRPHEVSALACVIGVDTVRLADVLAGRSALGWLVSRRVLAEALGVEAVGR
ncbi:hypothetical protein [Streptomyces formicae]